MTGCRVQDARCRVGSHRASRKIILCYIPSWEGLEVGLKNIKKYVF